NPRDLPLWAIVLCSFFALSLLPLIYHILTGWKAYKK
ncbi:xanthine permease, partial [Acinetobacter baumannii]